MGAALHGGRGARGLLSFSQREFSRRASLSRLGKPSRSQASVEAAQAQGAAGTNTVTTSELSTVEVGGSDPGGASEGYGASRKKALLGDREMVGILGPLQRASLVPTVTPQKDPS